MSDIFANLPPGTISGIVGVAALPAVGLIINTPFVVSLEPLFGINDDVAVAINTRTSFINTCFNDPSNIPIEVIWSWFGSAVIQLPPVTFLLGTRLQDPTKFFEAGSQGFPYLAISGTADKIIENDNVTAEIAPHFTNLEVIKIQGGSHALFIDNEDEFIRVLVPFANKILKPRKSARVKGTKRARSETSGVEW